MMIFKHVPRLLSTTYSAAPAARVIFVIAFALACAAARPGLDLQDGIGLQDALVQLAQGRAGLDAELVDEAAAGVQVGGQRGGLLPGPVQGEHQQLVHLLPQRLRRGQGRQLGDHLVVPAQVQVGVDAGFQRRQPHLGQLRHLRCQQRRWHIGQRPAAP